MWAELRKRRFSPALAATGCGRGVASALAVVVCLALAASDGHAYEFEVRARTVGQGYNLRSFRLLDGNLSLDRRRFTQTLSLDIWDLTNRLRDRRRYDLGRVSGPTVYISTYLRLDHDFGSWATGSLVVNSAVFDVVDLIPGLENELIALDVLYGYAAAEDLAGGWLDLYAGRLLEIDNLDWMSFDGIKARVETPHHIAVVAFAGLRVREATPALPKSRTVVTMPCPKSIAQ